MKIRDEDFEKFIEEEVGDEDDQAALRAHKKDIQSLGPGHLLRPDEIPDETVRNLVNKYKEDYKEFLSVMHQINGLIQAIEDVAENLENPKEFLPIKEALANVNLKDSKSVAAVEEQLIKPIMLPVLYHLLEKAKKDYGAANRKLYNIAAQIIGDIGKKESEDILIEALLSPAAESAAKALGKMGSKTAVPRLIEIVKEKREKTPGHVFEALGRLKDPRALDVLLEALNYYHDTSHDQYVIYALGKIGDKRALETLLNKLEDPGINKHEKEACIIALGNMGDEKALEAIIKNMPESKHVNYAIGRGLERNLSKLKDISFKNLKDLLMVIEYAGSNIAIKNLLANMEKAKREKLLLSCLKDKDVRGDALYILMSDQLAEHGYAPYLEALKEILEDSETTGYDKAKAIRLLGEQGETGNILEKIRNYASDWTTRGAVVEIAEKNIDIALPKLKELVYDPNNQEAALEIMKKMNSALTEEFFLAAIKEKSEDNTIRLVQRAAIEELGKTKNEKAIPHLIDLLDYEDRNLYIDEALQRIGGEKVISAMVTIVKDPEASFHKLNIALELLEKKYDETELNYAELIDPLIQHLNRQDLVESITRILGKLSSTEQKDTIVNKLLSNLENEDEGLIEGSISALGGINDVRAVEPLMEMLEQDKHRKTAISALGALGNIAIPTLRKTLLGEKNKEDTQLRGAIINVLHNSSASKSERDALLISLLDDSSELIRRNTINCFGYIKSESAVVALIAMLEKPENEKLFDNIIEALGKIGNTDATNKLIKLYESEKENPIKGPSLLDAIEDTKHEKAIPVLYAEGRILSAIELIKTKKPKKVDKRLERLIKIHEPIGRHLDNIAKYLNLLNEGNIAFLEKLVGKFSTRSAEIASGLYECLHLFIITEENKNELWLYLENIKVITPNLVRAYLEASNKNEFFAEVESVISGIVQFGKEDTSITSHPLYRDIIKSLYHNNAGNWTNYEKNRQCKDRTEDLAGYEMKSKYVLDLGATTELVIKKGQKLALNKLEPLKEKFYNWSKSWEAMGFDSEKMLEDIEARIDEKYELIKEKPWAKDADNTEKKLFALLINAVIHGEMEDEIKNLMIGYQFAKYEDIRAYIQGTTDRVAHARNKDYAYLGELHTFFADQIKEISRKIIEKAEEDDWLSDVLPEIFNDLREKEVKKEKKESLAKLNPKREADIEAFRKVLSKVLKPKKPGETHNWSIAKKMVLNKREKLAQIARLVGQEKYADPKRIHLGTITLDELMQTEEGLDIGKYSEETFSKYIAQRLLGLFSKEIGQIEEELAKFESKESKGRTVKKLDAYITKNHSSANARMVGGVCVAGDLKQWNDPDYLQLVFHDPDDSTCKGLALMHIWEEDGKKYLVASMNPSSTYLYSIDEKSLFDQICKTLIDFADENGIHGVGFSTKKHIRTNRTGGEFEQAMNKAIIEAKKKFEKKAELKFEEERVFSANPIYKIDDVDLIWIKE